MKNKIKKILTLALSLALALCTLGTAACNGGEKNITVVGRHIGSGTREAFDTNVTDGQGNYLEMKTANGKVYLTTDSADLQDGTGTVITKIISDKNAIGYISLSSVSDRLKVVSVNGVYPSAETVLDGTYKIQRPFVIMTSSTVSLSERAADFLSYLKSGAVEAHAQKAGCIYLSNPQQRANEGEAPIAVEDYVVKSALPSGDKITVSGSTSMELLLENAMKGYADLYGREVSEIFNALDLKGSTVGRSDVKSDVKGNVIGLSSASVKENGINSFNVCLDAVAVVVNVDNQSVNDLTLAELYDIYTAKITKFSELKKG